MKNFFKKLAFVLALAMVVTTIAPAAKASAAAKPAFKYSAKVLYIGGGDLTNSYGDTYKFTIKNAADYTKTWASSKKSVATVDKNGKVTAKAVGKTTITATLKKGKTVVELKGSVTVKQNAEKVGVGSLKAVKEMAVGDTAKVNVYRQVGDKKVWKQADKTICTDVIKWTTSDPSVATVDKWGKVTAVAAGKATITATATQVESTAQGAKKSFTVTVAAGLTSVKQASLNTITATFAGDLSAVANKDNVKVFQVIGNTKAVVLVKEVKFDDKDKTKATITTFTNFAKDTEYVVEYNDTSRSFKGADTDKKAVTQIVIKTDAVEPNTTKTLEFQLLDKDGVDITTDALLNDVTVESVGTASDYALIGKDLTIWNKDKTATIKAIFHTWTYGADAKEVQITAEKTILCSEKAAATLTGLGVATVYDYGTGNTRVDFSKSVTSISKEDSGKAIAIKTKNSDNADVVSTDSAHINDFTFSSTNETILLVDNLGRLTTTGKEGTAQIIVNYKKTPIGYVEITVGAKRTAAVVKPTWAGNKSNLSKGVADDSIVLNVEALDQFGSAAPASELNAARIEYLSGAVKASDAVIVPATNVDTNSGKMTFTFPGLSFTTEGSYNYQVVVGNQKVFFNFVVGDAKNTVSNYRFSEEGKVVDTKLNFYDATKPETKTDNKDFTMNLKGLAGNGYLVQNETLYATSQAAIESLQNASATGSAFYVEVRDKDGNVITTTSPFIDFTEGNKNITVKPIVASPTATSQLAKMPEGNYTVRAYKATRPDTTDTKNTTTLVATTGFSVTDTQVKATITPVNTTSSLGLSDANVQSVFADEKVATIKIGDVVINDSKYGSSILTLTTANYKITDKTAVIMNATLALPVQYKNADGTDFTTATVFYQNIDINMNVRFQ